MPPTHEEIERAMRIHAARILKARECDCDVCFREMAPAVFITEVLAWVLDRPVCTGKPTRPGLPRTFAAHLADLYGREDLAKLAHDHRIKEILPATPEAA